MISSCACFDAAFRLTATSTRGSGSISAGSMISSQHRSSIGMFCRPHLYMSMQPESASVPHTNAEGFGVSGRADNKLDKLQVVHFAQPFFGPEEIIAFSQVFYDGWVTM